MSSGLGGAAGVIRPTAVAAADFPRPRRHRWKRSPLWPRVSRSPALHFTLLYTFLLKMLSVLLAEAKVGCLSLSWQPAVEEKHLTSLSSPPSRCHHPPWRCHHLALRCHHTPDTGVIKNDDDICSFSHAQTLFMELVKALIDGAAKKGPMMTAAFSPCYTYTGDFTNRYTHWTWKYIHTWTCMEIFTHTEHKYMHI